MKLQFVFLVALLACVGMNAQTIPYFLYPTTTQAQKQSISTVDTIPDAALSISGGNSISSPPNYEWMVNGVPKNLYVGQGSNSNQYNMSEKINGYFEVKAPEQSQVFEGNAAPAIQRQKGSITYKLADEFQPGNEKMIKAFFKKIRDDVKVLEKAMLEQN